jgi:hypothetical protein
MSFYLFLVAIALDSGLRSNFSAESGSGQLTDDPVDVHQNTYVVMSLSI